MAESFPCTGPVSASLVQQLSNKVLCILRNPPKLWAREVWVFVQSVLDAPERIVMSLLSTDHFIFKLSDLTSFPSQNGSLPPDTSM